MLSAVKSGWRRAGFKWRRTEIFAPYHLYRTLLERAASQKTHRRSGSLDKPGTARQILQSVGIC